MNSRACCRNDVLKDVSEELIECDLRLTIFEIESPSDFSQSENGLTLPDGLILIKMIYKMVKK